VVFPIFGTDEKINLPQHGKYNSEILSVFKNKQSNDRL
jgi:hypothetical protein